MIASNNLVTYNSLSGFKAFNGDRPLVVYNTVVANAFGGSSGAGDGGFGAGFNTRERVHNNIFVSNRYGINIIRSDGVYSHNIVWGNSSNYVGRAARATGDLDVDPEFVNPVGDDFHLRDTSPAIGSAEGSLSSETSDMDGTVRPQGSAPDRGAYELIVPVSSAGIVISEVMANPVDEDRGEFVEVYNSSTVPFDLAGTFLSDGDVVDIVVAIGGGSTVVGPGEYAVILDSEYAGGYGIPTSGCDLDAAADQSNTRSPDVTGAFEPHSSTAGSDGALFSPGTRIDGSDF